MTLVKKKASLSDMNFHEIKDSYNNEGNNYHLDLSSYLDFSSAKMDSLDVSLDPESPGKIGSFKKVFDSTVLEDLLEGPKQVIKIDKSRYLIP